MVNKRGILRIIEASIAILIIAGVLLIIFMGGRDSGEEDLRKHIHDLLDEAAKDSALRKKIVDCGGLNNCDSIEGELEDFLRERISSIGANIELEAEICELEEAVCQSDGLPNSNDIYVGERAITSTPDTYDPKRVKLYMWRR